MLVLSLSLSLSYAIKLTFFFYRNLLKLARIVCVIVRIYPMKNEDNPTNIMGKWLIYFIYLFLVYAIKSKFLLKLFVTSNSRFT